LITFFFSADCEGTSYQRSVSAVPFRRCDNRNLGISKFCQLADADADDLPDPLPYAAEVLTEYEAAGDIPSYVSGRLRTNRRFHSADAAQEIFTYADTTYDAYEKDIALVTFYYENPTVFQFKRDSRMDGVGFLSQVRLSNQSSQLILRN